VTRDRRRPLVIAHRGLSGLHPEHTLAAYDAAILAGADFIEPDLVFTKDGVLIVRHEHWLSTSTDIASRPEFADRRRMHVTRKGERIDDWFSEDFTLAEIKSLRCRQAFPGRSTEEDGRYEIPTFGEVIALAVRRGADLGRTIGLYPETKEPAYFASIGFDFKTPLLEALRAEGLDRAEAPLIVQSFEPEILRDLAAMSAVPRMMLLTQKPGGAPGEPNLPLVEVAAFADFVGPHKGLICPGGREVTGFLVAAQGLGLGVHPWTFRDDALPQDGAFANGVEEIAFYLMLGVDGVFTDFAATAVRAREFVQSLHR
jgi:glycerophosphoryl diester phosphodiesterase